MNEQLCTVIAKARELLGPNGEHWTKAAFYRDTSGIDLGLMEVEGGFDDDDEPVEGHIVPVNFCVLGSIRFAARTLALSPEKMDEAFVEIARPIIQSRVDNPHSAVTEYNDDKGATFPEIASLLDEVKAQACAPEESAL